MLNKDNSQKVAKLVYVDLCTRVIVDANATEDEILEKAKPTLLTKLNDDIMEHCSDIKDDTEMPYEQGK